MPPVCQPADDDRETVDNVVLYMFISAGFCPHWSGLITSQLSLPPLMRIMKNGEPANATADTKKVASLVRYNTWS